MSAFLVSEAHITALVDVAANGPSDRSAKYPGDGWHTPSLRYACESAPFGIKSLDPRHEPDPIGVWLWSENATSVAYLYHEPAEETYTYTFERPSRRLTTVEALKAIDGYVYQSCEHPEWKDSPAKQFVELLRLTLIGNLPGYNEADTWSID